MGEKHNDGDAAKKGPLTVVLKVEMHCGGCASKIAKSVKGLEGVEGVKTEWEADKLTIIGKVDPVKIRDMVAEKTKKKVDLVSPLPKKDDKGKADEKKPEEKNPKEEKKEEKKPKEPPVTTAVLKLSLHCQGCIDKIHKILAKTDGIQEKCIDRQKDLVTVKGTMDAKSLVESLKKNLKRSVEIVPPKKEKDDKEKEGGEGAKKGAKEDDGGGAPKMEAINRMEFMAAQPFGYAPMEPYRHPNPYPPQDGYGYGNAYPVPHPQMFSDENPNACAVM